MDGRCACGRVTITLSNLPETINACPCDFCRHVGARWGYFPSGSVTIDGETRAYPRASRIVEFCRCANCGVTTHWIDPEGGTPHMGVHMEEFDPEATSGVPVVIEP